MDPAPEETVRRSGLRRATARVFAATVVVVQVGFLVRAYWDPHSHFGYQPFNESSTFRADIVRVMPDGSTRPIRHGWAGYQWSELVRSRGLAWPWFMGHADSGIGSTLDFLDKALDYVADHTPRDRETGYLEARVTYFQNRRGPRYATLRSKDRDLD